jgi:hypothetical protein
MSVGFAIVVAGVLVFAARSIVDSAVLNSLVKVEANKPRAMPSCRSRRRC